MPSSCWLSQTGRPRQAHLSDGSATIEPWIAVLRAHMMRDGVERALADANLALDQLPPGSWWIPGALRMRGVAHALLGATDRATEDLEASIAAAQALGAPGDDVPLAQALLALRAAETRGVGRGRRTRTGGTGDRRREGPRRLRGQRNRARCDGTGRTPRGRDTTRRERRWRAPTVCGRCSTTAFPG